MLYQDETDFLSERLSHSSQRIEAIAWMLSETIHHDSSCLSSVGEGIYKLFENEAGFAAKAAKEARALEFDLTTARSEKVGGNREAEKFAAELRSAVDTARGLRSASKAKIDDTLHDIQRGVCDLFEVAGFDRALADEAWYQAGRLQSVPADQIAALATVDPATAERIQRDDAEAAALRHQSAKLDAHEVWPGLVPETTGLSPDQLRQKAIADMLRGGAETPNIAAALNMRQTAVEKLISKLRGEPPAPTA